MVGKQIVLVNRTSSPINFVADSQHHILVPGDNYGYVETQAPFAMAQNPLMGSEDYHTMEFESLVGIKGETPCDPIPDDVLLRGMETVERFNREDAGLAPVKMVAPRHRMPRGRAGTTTGGNENAFAVGH